MSRSQTAPFYRNTALANPSFKVPAAELDERGGKVLRK
jgi:hypothetical protein